MNSSVILFSLLLILTSCENGDNLNALEISKFKGSWTIEQVYANDHWGGPLYWRSIDGEKQIKFTSDKYYEKIMGDYELIGTYKILSNHQIEITWNSEYPAYQLDYSFEKGDLTLFNSNKYEGVVGEKFSDHKQLTFNDD